MARASRLVVLTAAVALVAAASAASAAAQPRTLVVGSSATYPPFAYENPQKQIVGFEITDVAPMLDHSQLSVMHGNAVLNACLVGVAVRKAGLSPEYVHPLALDHGQR